MSQDRAAWTAFWRRRALKAQGLDDDGRPALSESREDVAGLADSFAGLGPIGAAIAAVLLFVFRRGRRCR